jgi:hypothetical protein
LKYAYPLNNAVNYHKKDMTMVRPFLRFVLMTAPFWMPCATLAEESITRSFSVPHHGSIQLEAPKSWQSNISQPPNNTPPTIIFTQQGAHKSELRLLPMWPPTPDLTLPDPDEIRSKVEEAAEKLQSQSVEKEFLIRELKGPFVVGYYFTGTDKAPKPGEYKYTAQGMFRVGELLTAFMVLTNDSSGNFIDETIIMLKNATHAK